MTKCKEPTDLGQLVAYALGELPEETEAAVEAHYFDCAECTERLQWVQALARGVADLVRAGLVTTGVRETWVRRAAREGARLRQYTLEAGYPVNCTVTADDDFVIVRLRVDRPLSGQLLVETEFHDLEHDHRERRDLPAQFVDDEAGELLYAFSGALVRGFPRSRWVMHVCDSSGQRLGPYTMNHTPGA